MARAASMPMSERGTKRTWLDVRLESAFGEERKSNFGAVKSVDDPGCVKTFFLPQKLHATGDDPHRNDGLSIFLLYRVRSQPGRKLGPR